MTFIRTCFSLALLDGDRRQRGRAAGRQRDPGLAALGFEEPDGLPHQRIQIAGLPALAGGRPREGEQVVQQGADALDLREREIAEAGAELLVVQPLG